MTDTLHDGIVLTDPDASARRRDELARRLGSTDHVVVGDAYDLVLDGRPHRLLVVGDDPGGGLDRLGTELALRVLLDRSPHDHGDGILDLAALARPQHLATTIEVLEPTVLLAEGWSTPGSGVPSASTEAAAVLGVTVPKPMSLTALEQPWGSVAFVAAVAPALSWTTTRHPKWRILERILVEARQLVLGR